MTVPALPGSRTSAQRTASVDPRANASASGTSRKRQTATSPAGVTLSLSEARAAGSTSVHSGAAAARAAYCTVASGVAKTSTTQPSTDSAPSTAFGPSARKSRRSARTERRLSFAASLTRVLLRANGTVRRGPWAR